jgi:glyoxylase-like metal-dependent hydrolase (beta-lactamase superfamily II)
LEYAILTHLHLDHAGGTSALLKACPRAVVLAHPRAVRHLIDPSRLLSSAERVYGKEIFEAVYGPMEPIEAERVRSVADGERLRWGNRTLTFLHTPGHAKHHVCLHDSESNGIFTGDTFGVSYGPLRQSDPACLLPSCPPTDWDPEQARDSIRRIMETGAGIAFLGHFGEYAPLKAGAAQLMAALDRLEEILRDIVRDDRPREELISLAEVRIRAVTEEHLKGHCGLSLSEEDWAWLEPEIQLNAQGLIHAAERLRSA